MERLTFCFFIAALCVIVPPSLRGDEDSGCLRDEIITAYDGVVPARWGETVDGVRTRIVTRRKIVALTFDACGSKGDGCDWRLIHFLQREHIPATLFISGKWIDAHPDDFALLAKDSLFEIENHGLNHRPCSVNGRSIYGIAGTRDPGEVFDEIEENGRKIRQLTRRKPLFYRSGTAYYDETGIAIAHRLGYEVMGFSILGDAGATYRPEQVKDALLTAIPGSIAICHMNHPDRGTADGVIAAIPELRKRGFSFVRLSGYRLQ
jgi:peptidoglycan/xylan/chitin deacetylase (PgdA/CDA1 family)